MNTPFSVNQQEIDEKVKFLSSAKCNHTQHMYIDITGDLIQGTLLARIMYWFSAGKNKKSKVRIFKDGYFWIAKQRKDWWDEIRITERQYDKAIRELKKKGFVELAKYKFNSMPTIHIRPNYDNINAATEKWEDELRQSIIEEYHQELPKSKNGNYTLCDSNGIDTKCKTGITQKGSLLTLITNNDYNTENTNRDYNNKEDALTSDKDRMDASFPKEKEEGYVKLGNKKISKTKYTHPELELYLPHKIRELYAQENLILDEYGEELVKIVMYFYRCYRICRKEKHPLLTDISYEKIVTGYLNPPEIMQTYEVFSFDVYKNMIDRYFATDFGKYSGTPKNFNYRISHFISDTIREHLYRQLMESEI